MLKVRPVRRTGALRYPDKDDALAHPELLERLPARWRACRQAVAAAGLAATLTAVLSACDGLVGQSTDASSQMPSSTPFLQKTPEIVGTSAPLLFVSEAEALEIIERVAKPSLANAVHSVEPSAKHVVFVSYNNSVGGYVEVNPTIEDIDLFDSDKEVGIEYISETENNNFTFCSDSSVQLNAENSYVLVIPAVADSTGYGYTSESFLQQQVEDFLSWLKAEGII